MAKTCLISTLHPIPVFSLLVVTTILLHSLIKCEGKANVKIQVTDKKGRPISEKRYEIDSNESKESITRNRDKGSHRNGEEREAIRRRKEPRKRNSDSYEYYADYDDDQPEYSKQHKKRRGGKITGSKYAGTEEKPRRNRYRGRGENKKQTDLYYDESSESDNKRKSTGRKSTDSSNKKDAKYGHQEVEESSVEESQKEGVKERKRKPASKGDVQKKNSKSNANQEKVAEKESSESEESEEIEKKDKKPKKDSEGPINSSKQKTGGSCNECLNFRFPIGSNPGAPGSG